MMEVRPLERKRACPRSPVALKLPHQYGPQVFKVEKHWAYHYVPPWGWVVVLLLSACEKRKAQRSC